jgi:hypothetical protein
MSAAARDRNLLFGILALQVNFISRDTLIRGPDLAFLRDREDFRRLLAALLPAQ